jgi:hypothetical protein
MKGFGNRVTLLLFVMAVVVIVDFKRNRKSASKHKEYGFILFAGMIGAVIGMLNDLITSGISPDYFIYGKDLECGSNLQWRAGIFGAQEGISAGIIGGAICLFATSQKSGYSPETMRFLLRGLWMPSMGAVVAGFALPLIAGTVDPFRLSKQLDSFLGSEKIDEFLHAWWIHIGLYIGLVFGIAALIWRTRSQSRNWPATIS